MPGFQPSVRSSSGSRIKALKKQASMWGWQLVRSYRDRRGVFCVKIKTDRSVLYCITKDYAYKQQASFPRRVALRAADTGQPVAIFFGDKPEMGNAYVFDSQLVIEEGHENTEDRDVRNPQVWLDIPLERGVILGDYISGRADI